MTPCAGPIRARSSWATDCRSITIRTRSWPPGAWWTCFPPTTTWTRRTAGWRRIISRGWPSSSRRRCSFRNFSSPPPRTARATKTTAISCTWPRRPSGRPARRRPCAISPRSPISSASIGSSTATSRPAAVMTARTSTWGWWTSTTNPTTG